jgi:hypothetical protein
LEQGEQNCILQLFTEQVNNGESVGRFPHTWHLPLVLLIFSNENGYFILLNSNYWYSAFF